MYYYYEEGYQKKVTRRMSYHIYLTKVDDEQKRNGTDFQSWLYDMVKAGLLVPA